MLTPQEVSGRAFSKAAFGGYNMAMVDEFLDEVTDDYTALYKENAALKAKLKVLVDKVAFFIVVGCFEHCFHFFRRIGCSFIYYFYRKFP